MIDEKAMSLIPTYAQTKIPHREEATETMFARLMNHAAERIRVSFRRKWGILIIGAALFTIYTVILSASVAHRTEVRVRQEMAGEAAAAVEQYKQEQARETQKQYFLSGGEDVERHPEGRHHLQRPGAGDEQGVSGHDGGSHRPAESVDVLRPGNQVFHA